MISDNSSVVSSKKEREGMVFFETVYPRVQHKIPPEKTAPLWVLTPFVA